MSSIQYRLLIISADSTALSVNRETDIPIAEFSRARKKEVVKEKLKNITNLQPALLMNKSKELQLNSVLQGIHLPIVIRKTPGDSN